MCLVLSRTFPRCTLRSSFNFSWITAGRWRCFHSIFVYNYFYSPALKCGVKFYNLFYFQPTMTHSELFTAMLLINHLISLRTNVFQIHQLYQPKNKNTPDASNTPIGIGVCMLHSLINHSCDPNVRHFVRGGREHVLMAVRPIKKGQQVSCIIRATLAVNPRHGRSINVGLLLGLYFVLPVLLEPFSDRSSSVVIITLWFQLRMPSVL